MLDKKFFSLSGRVIDKKVMLVKCLLHRLHKRLVNQRMRFGMLPFFLQPTGSRVAIKDGLVGVQLLVRMLEKGHWLKMAIRELSHGMDWTDFPLLAVNLMRLPYYGKS